jgi:hypothetical protein
MNDVESHAIGKQLDTSLFEAQIPRKQQCDKPPPEGKPWWVKSKLDCDTYLVSTASGFDVWNAIAVRK